MKGPSFRSIPFQFPFPFFVFINCITDTTGPTPTLSSFLLLPPPSSSFLLLLLPTIGGGGGGGGGRRLPLVNEMIGIFIHWVDLDWC